MAPMKTKKNDLMMNATRRWKPGADQANPHAYGPHSSRSALFALLFGAATQPLDRRAGTGQRLGGQAADGLLLAGPLARKLHEAMLATHAALAMLGP
jgi:hypothetical protein